MKNLWNEEQLLEAAKKMTREVLDWDTPYKYWQLYPEDNVYSQSENLADIFVRKHTEETIGMTLEEYDNLMWLDRYHKNNLVIDVFNSILFKHLALIRNTRKTFKRSDQYTTIEVEIDGKKVKAYQIKSGSDLDKHPLIKGQGFYVVKHEEYEEYKLYRGTTKCGWHWWSTLFEVYKLLPSEIWKQREALQGVLDVACAKGSEDLLDVVNQGLPMLSDDTIIHFLSTYNQPEPSTYSVTMSGDVKLDSEVTEPLVSGLMYKDANDFMLAYSNYKHVLFRSTYAKKMLDEAVEKMTQSRDELSEFSQLHTRSCADIKDRWGVNLK